MSLKQNIETEIKKAMLAKDKDRLRALRGIKSLIMLEETKGGSTGVSEEDEMKILTKAAKQRKDSADIYQQQNREDLAAVEFAELEIINEFLPKQLSEEEVEAVIAEVGAEGPKDMGKVMGVATKKLAGKADGKLISQKVKNLLA
jgi:uncharacterized protein YqeY